MKSLTPTIISLVITLVVLPTSGLARQVQHDDRQRFSTAANGPAYCIAEHNIGRMELAITNVGSYGSKLSDFLGENSCFTGGGDGSLGRRCSWTRHAGFHRT